MYIPKVFGEKRQWRQYQARSRQLPENYRNALEALERYLTYAGAITRGDVMMSMLEDLTDLFEQSAANRTPIRAIVAENPVEFADGFLRNYSQGQWINKERQRLTDSIDGVAGDEPSAPPRPGPRLR